LSLLTSPCVGVCQYDEESGLCLGCNRSQPEISDWKRMDEKQQKAIYAELPERRAKLGFGFPVIPWSHEEAIEFIQESLTDSHCTWSIGAYGALAEFSYDEQETKSLLTDNFGARLETERGAISFNLSRPFKAIALTNDIGRLSEIVFGAFRTKYDSFPQTTIAEKNRDGCAVPEEYREKPIFDLGLGLPHASFFVRPTDQSTTELLRSHEGENFFEHTELTQELKACSPHRVVKSPLGRIEVYQPIPKSNGKTPDGPHTHLKPEALKTGELHTYGTHFPPEYRVGLSLYLGQSDLADKVPL